MRALSQFGNQPCSKTLAQSPTATSLKLYSVRRPPSRLPQDALNASTLRKTTHPDHALLRLHGRNAQAYGMPAKTAVERFDYAYTSDELQALATRFSPIAPSVKYAHSVFNNCMEDKSQLNAKAFRALLVDFHANLTHYFHLDLTHPFA